MQNNMVVRGGRYVYVRWEKHESQAGEVGGILKMHNVYISR